MRRNQDPDATSGRSGVVPMNSELRCSQLVEEFSSPHRAHECALPQEEKLFKKSRKIVVALWSSHWRPPASPSRTSADEQRRRGRWQGHPVQARQEEVQAGQPVPWRRQQQGMGRLVTQTATRRASTSRSRRTSRSISSAAPSAPRRLPTARRPRRRAPRVPARSYLGTGEAEVHAPGCCAGLRWQPRGPAVRGRRAGRVGVQRTRPRTSSSSTRTARTSEPASPVVDGRIVNSGVHRLRQGAARRPDSGDRCDAKITKFNAKLDEVAQGRQGEVQAEEVQVPAPGHLQGRIVRASDPQAAVHAEAAADRNN